MEYIYLPVVPAPSLREAYNTALRIAQTAVDQALELRYEVRLSEGESEESPSSEKLRDVMRTLGEVKKFRSKPNRTERSLEAV